MSNDIVVVIDGAQVKERAGSFKNDAGEQVDYKTRKQDARLEAGGFAYPYEVRLEDGQAPFPPGRYRMRPEKMLTVNKGTHAFSKYAVLEAIPATTTRAAATA